MFVSSGWIPLSPTITTQFVYSYTIVLRGRAAEEQLTYADSESAEDYTGL